MRATASTVRDNKKNNNNKCMCDYRAVTWLISDDIKIMTNLCLSLMLTMVSFKLYIRN